MRIGFDARALAFPERPTGLYQYSYNLIKSLDELDEENEYLLFFNSFNRTYRGNIEAYDFGSNFRKVNCPLPHILSEPLFDTLHFPVDVFLGAIDVFHGPSFEILPHLSGSSVVTVQDVMFITNPEFLPSKKAEEYRVKLGRSLKKADAVIAISEYTRKELMRFYPLDEEAVRVIPCGVGTAFRPEGRGNIERVKGKHGIRGPYILYLGNVEPKKNLLTLVEAFSMLERGVRDSTTLVIAGPLSYPEYHARVQRGIKELGVQDRVKFIGAVPASDAPCLYGGAEVFAFPSLYEGFGIPPLEAMACGTPVVASSIPAIREVSGEAALLVDPLNAREMAAALSSLLKDGALRKRLKEEGTRRSSLYSWEKTARMTLSLYKEVSEKKGRSRKNGAKGR